MKKLLAFLCSLVITVSAAAFASADPSDVTRYLEPGEQYGHLYPYIQESEFAIEYGFCNEEGRKITDPNYSEVRRLPLGDGFFYALGGYNRDDEYTWQYASSDGKIVSDMCFQSIDSLGGEYILCMRDWEEPTFEVLNSDFEICAIELDFQYYGKSLIPMDYKDGKYICRYMDSCLLTDDTMQPLSIAAFQIFFDSFGDAILSDELGNTSVILPDNSLYTLDGESLFLSFARMNENCILATSLNGVNRVVDLQGNDLYPDVKTVHIGWNGGYLLSGDESSPDCTYRVLDINGNLLLEGTGEEYARWQDTGAANWFSRREEGRTVIWNFETGEEQVIPAECYHEILWDTAKDPKPACSYYLDDTNIWLLLPSGKLFNVDPMTLNYLNDPVDGTSYWAIWKDDTMTLYAADFETELLTFSGWYELGEGVIAVMDNSTCTLYRMDGSVLFEHEYGAKG